jgi:hypothetical protein
LQRQALRLHDLRVDRLLQQRQHALLHFG